MPWMRAAVSMAMSRRLASSSPAWGPAPVTTVPVTRAIAVSTATPAACREISGDTGRTSAPSSGSPARCTSVTAVATSASDTSMWPCTATGLRSTSTVIPPSTIWASTPPTSPTASHVRSRRRGHAHERTEHGEDDGDADDAGEQAVELLDRGVRARDVDELAGAALRPVATPEAGVGEAHGCPRDDDRAQREEGEQCDGAVPRRRQPHRAKSTDVPPSRRPDPQHIRGLERSRGSATTRVARRASDASRPRAGPMWRPLRGGRRRRRWWGVRRAGGRTGRTRPRRRGAGRPTPAGRACRDRRRPVPTAPLDMHDITLTPYIRAAIGLRSHVLGERVEGLDVDEQPRAVAAPAPRRSCAPSRPGRSCRGGSRTW